MHELLSGVSSSSGPVDPGLLVDGDLSGGVELRPLVAGQPAYLQLEFPEPFPARSLTVWTAPLGAHGAFRMPGVGPALLEASEDGISFRKIAELFLGGGMRGGEVPVTVSFPCAGEVLSSGRAATTSDRGASAFGGGAPG